MNKNIRTVLPYVIDNEPSLILCFTTYISFIYTNNSLYCLLEPTSLLDEKLFMSMFSTICDILREDFTL